MQKREKLSGRYGVWAYPVLEHTMVWLVLVVILLYAYAEVVRLPYIGFDWDPSSGNVQRVYGSGELRLGDQIIQIDSTPADDFQQDLRQTLFTDVRPGDTVDLTIVRDGRTFTLAWVIPGFYWSEFWRRLVSQWLVAMLFWIAGLSALFFLRPQDTLRRVLIAFNCASALWLGASVVSRWHVWESAIVLRSAVWLWAPITLHLHWIFPTSVRPVPSSVGWSLYGAAALLALAEWFRWLPNQAYAIGLLSGLAGSLVLLAVHFFRRADRSEIIPIVSLGGVALGLSLILVVIQSLGLRSYLALAGGLLALPLLPGAYFYAAYRRQLGGLELRANRVISLYLFFLVLGVVFAILLPLAEALPDFPTRLTLIGLGSAALVAFLALFAFGPFQRFVERRLLGMPLAQSRLLETYAAEITVSLNTSRLVTLLQEKILPSLLVRQSALLRFDGPVHTTLYAAGVDPAQLPAPESIPDLLALAGKYRAPAKDGAQPCSWARLVLPLAASQQSIGVWLLGRRDPDDFYSQAEIPTLQSLAHQTAVALINIVQAERLHALYQTDIDRAETERAALARRLHDHLLNELAVLKLSMGDYTPPPEFLNRYEALTADLRQIVSGLRPPMLGYGLHPALSALVSAATERTAPGLSVLLELPETDMRYDPQVERHLYRIVQQSVDNALRHAQAGRVVIKGRLEADRIALSIEDDGIGFATGEQLDVAGFVAHKHFGLAGMLERAALVNATMQIESAPGRGTRVGVTWTR